MRAGVTNELVAAEHHVDWRAAAIRHEHAGQRRAPREQHHAEAGRARERHAHDRRAVGSAAAGRRLRARHPLCAEVAARALRAEHAPADERQQAARSDAERELEADAKRRWPGPYPGTRNGCGARW